MRYYHMTLNTNADLISEKSHVKLRDYSYDNTIEAFNSYMYRTLKNDVCFVIYREDEEELPALLSYDDSKCSYEEAYTEVVNVLRKDFEISAPHIPPKEITMHDFMFDSLEGKRRGYLNYYSRLMDASKVWIYEYEYMHGIDNPPFRFTENIISDKKKTRNYLLDESFKNELTNIETHEEESACTENIAHYILAVHGTQAAHELTEKLGAYLLEANRISSRRIAYISEIDPACYKHYSTQFEQIIEYNYGGIVSIDLSEKFACNPVDYKLVCLFIENLVKTHCKHCLFVFTYNIEHPGFAYQLLPNLKKYLIPVILREGSGDRKEALYYLKQKLRDSEYSEYVGQAGEYLKQYRETFFTHTDIMDAFERFGPWCKIRNNNPAYQYTTDDDFFLEVSSQDADPYAKLQSMIGLKPVKEQIDKILAADLIEKARKNARGGKYQTASMHMVFAGDPGTAKTTVAEKFAAIAKEKGILKSGTIKICGGMDLCCVDDIRDAFKAADGGVLFIDEAYSIPGFNTIAALIQEMENRRDNVIVILAGYRNLMKSFMKRNAGLKSRIPFWVDFPNYSPEELTEIFRYMLDERGFTATDEAILEAKNIFEKAIFIDDFGNGRYVRNLVELAALNQSTRLASETAEVGDIKEKKLFLITKEDVEEPDAGVQHDRAPGTARKELEELIGLENAKALIKKAIAYFKMKKQRLDRGTSSERAAMHMVFTGSPGTAKTTVARLFAEILKDEKVLPVGQFVEAGRADLVGAFVGHTAIQVTSKFHEAKGGVLFIDEAYSLCDDNRKSFGDEAIDTIVKEMENNREDTIVIFAGYTEPMQEFLDRNPGMRSRIAFHVDFDDYTVEELCDIAKLKLSQKNMTITDEAMDKLRTNFEIASRRDSFGNGRYVRKMLDEAEMNLAERIIESGIEDPSEELLNTLEVQDIPDEEEKHIQTKAPIGFAV